MLTQEQKTEIKKNVEEFSTSLKLSDEQKVEFEEITKKYAKQMISIRDSGGGKFKKMRKLRTMGKEKNEELKPLLSEAQYTVYLDKQEEMRNKMRARQSGL